MHAQFMWRVLASAPRPESPVLPPAPQSFRAYFFPSFEGGEKGLWCHFSDPYLQVWCGAVLHGVWCGLCLVCVCSRCAAAAACSLPACLNTPLPRPSPLQLVTSTAYIASVPATFLAFWLHGWCAALLVPLPPLAACRQAAEALASLLAGARACCRGSRVVVLFLGGVAYTIAAAVQSTSQNLGMLYTGRAIVGVGMAFGNQAAPVSPVPPAGERHLLQLGGGAGGRLGWRVHHPLRRLPASCGHRGGGHPTPTLQVYMSEMALPKSRGLLTSSYQFAVVIGAPYRRLHQRYLRPRHAAGTSHTQEGPAGR